MYIHYRRKTSLTTSFCSHLVSLFLWCWSLLPQSVSSVSSTQQLGSSELCVIRSWSFWNLDFAGLKSWLLTTMNNSTEGKSYKFLTLFGTRLKIYVKWWGMFSTTPSKHPKSLWKNNFFCFSDRSYRNRKSHEIWGHLEAILRVFELIFGRGGVERPLGLK